MEYDDFEEAKEQVSLGKAWAAIYLGHNFTKFLFSRACALARASCPMKVPPIDEEIINGSSVHVYADVTSMSRLF